MFNANLQLDRMPTIWSIFPAQEHLARVSAFEVTFCCARGREVRDTLDGGRRRKIVTSSVACASCSSLRTRLTSFAWKKAKNRKLLAPAVQLMDSAIYAGDSTVGFRLISNTYPLFYRLLLRALNVSRYLWRHRQHWTTNMNKSWTTQLPSCHWKLLMRESGSFLKADQSAAFAMKEFVYQNESSCVVEIRSPMKARSVTCKTCEARNKRRTTFYARIRSYLLERRNIEAKLKKFNVKSGGVVSPFGFLRQLFAGLLQPETETKFTYEELEKLTESQLAELKESLENLMSTKTKELKQEQLACIGEREDLEKKKNKARELESMAWLTLRPFINKHPSSDDLTRVLMF